LTNFIALFCVLNPGFGHICTQDVGIPHVRKIQIGVLKINL
jgi:hypothetical protein